MTLTSLFLIGLAFAIPELVLVENWAWLKRVVSSNPIWEMGFSLAFGYALGMAMNIPPGATIAIANVFSTVITISYYRLDPLVKYRKFKAWSELRRGQVQHACSRVSYRYNQVRHPLRGSMAQIRGGVARAKRGRV